MKAEGKKKEMFLIAYGIAIVPIMFAVIYGASHILGKQRGYLGGYAVYLILLLIGIWSIRPRAFTQSDKICKYRWLYYMLAFIPVGATFVVAFLPEAQMYSGKLILFTLAYAVLNGTLEELFWRYTYNEVFGEKMMLSYILPTINFTCWHFALLLAKGMIYSGGAAALVGGAGIMGVLWGLMVYKTKNIKVSILAHVLVNFFAFSQLIYENGLI